MLKPRKVDMAAPALDERIAEQGAADRQVDDRRPRQLARAIRYRQLTGKGCAIDRAVNDRRNDAQLSRLTTET
jgi:hypothetical protein